MSRDKITLTGGNHRNAPNHALDEFRSRAFVATPLLPSRQHEAIRKCHEKRIRSYICTRESIGQFLAASCLLLKEKFQTPRMHSQVFLPEICMSATPRPILSPLLDARLRCTALYGLKFGPSNLHCTQSSSDCHPTDTTRIGQSPGSICHRLEGFQQPFTSGRNQANILNRPA